MDKATVERAARRAGIGLDGIEVEINEAFELAGRGVYGYAYPDGHRIVLYPDAVSSLEQLVRTLAHERMHAFQAQLYGEARSSLEVVAREQAAYACEEQSWRFFLEHP
jgi:hypothetical protein